eukprot:SAG31_NODE_13250_length_882_cov_1.790549_2_plen_177_part_00
MPCQGCRGLLGLACQSLQGTLLVRGYSACFNNNNNSNVHGLFMIPVGCPTAYVSRLFATTRICICHLRLCVRAELRFVYLRLCASHRVAFMFYFSISPPREHVVFEAQSPASLLISLSLTVLFCAMAMNIALFAILKRPKQSTPHCSKISPLRSADASTLCDPEPIVRPTYTAVHF